jgi:hypothetical protein
MEIVSREIAGRLKSFTPSRRIVYLPVMRARERAACHQVFIVEEAQWREALAFRRWCLAP